jgi:hypothetical protein
VTVVTPGPGGGISTAQTFTIVPGAPSPLLSTLAPSSATEGGAGFTLTVTGSNFQAGSMVHWNGLARPTRFMNNARLTATIAAADIATAGDVDVTVVLPGGSRSSARHFKRLLSKRLLIVSRHGSGSGHVTSPAPVLDCRTLCSVPVDRGTSVTLTATPASGSVFTGWSGGCSGAAITCTVTLDAARTVTADFTLLSVLGFSAATYSVSEAGTAAAVTVVRSGGMHAGVTVDVVTSDGTAHAGADYATVVRTLTFAAGQTSQRVMVPVSNGTLADRRGWPCSARGRRRR